MRASTRNADRWRSSADGPFAYVILSSGPPGAVDHRLLFDAARRLYARVKDAPLH